ncbi:F0F1 ATP synthase subunit B [Cohaesibacter sp. CAU 1516]|uniref:F0F1 ATP synthase subunit B n=1 Tax=Cohaesibacter sp. CAU 1516 TaxID=2576038 RepID=UPI001485B6CE|nr:F0F1 ATP synthase subunit B [Cohaesibacter sp. CAU 1516]
MAQQQSDAHAETEQAAEVGQPMATESGQPVNAHTEVAGHGGDHHDGGAFPPFDSTTYGSQLLWLAITFGLLYYIMSKVALPRIANILEVRRDRIASDLGEAERLKRETDEAIASYEQSLAEARQKAHGIAHTAREEAKTQFDAEFAKVEADIAKQLTAADEKITAVKTAAMGEVDAIAQSTTEAILEQLLGSGVAKKDIAAAVSAAKAN